MQQGASRHDRSAIAPSLSTRPKSCAIVFSAAWFSKLTTSDAITGLKLINGGGRAEVDAAHTRPVEANGPDVLSNGIALSGTATGCSIGV